MTLRPLAFPCPRCHRAMFHYGRHVVSSCGAAAPLLAPRQRTPCHGIVCQDRCAVWYDSPEAVIAPSGCMLLT